MGLSKSKFIAGWQCLKRLYLEVHQPELAGEPDERTQAVLEQGHEVGRWAQKRFPAGLLIEASPQEMAKALKQTEQALADRQYGAIFEATFAHDNVLARVDVLERLPANQWRLVEVKSSTGVKDYYLYDVALQRHVLEGLGMNVVPCLMHLNREYVYDGRQYDLEKLFVIRDLTSETAALQQQVKDLLREEWKALDGAEPPDIAPGDHCTHPFACAFFDLCNKPLPDGHVRYLPGISAKKLQELARRGIESIKQIPQDFPLTERQERAWDCARTGEPWFGEGLKTALAELRYPLCLWISKPCRRHFPASPVCPLTTIFPFNGRSTCSPRLGRNWSTTSSSRTTRMIRDRNSSEPCAWWLGTAEASSRIASGSSQGA